MEKAASGGCPRAALGRACDQLFVLDGGGDAWRAGTGNRAFQRFLGQLGDLFGAFHAGLDGIVQIDDRDTLGTGD